MPSSAQALYFHLGMGADDDGVVEAFMVMRTTKAAEDDFRVLVAKKFIVPLNEEQVSYILDWNEHNLIRADRLVPSIHRELLVRVIPDVELVEPKTRADLKQLTGRPVDNQRTAQDRLGEVSVSKDINTSVAIAPQELEIKEEKEADEEGIVKKSPPKYPNAKKVFALWGKYPKNWDLNTTQLRAAENLFEERELDEIENAVKWYSDLKDREFCPQVSTPYELDSKWSKFEKFVNEQEI